MNFDLGQPGPPESRRGTSRELLEFVGHRLRETYAPLPSPKLRALLADPDRFDQQHFAEALRQEVCERGMANSVVVVTSKREAYEHLSHRSDRLIVGVPEHVRRPSYQDDLDAFVASDPFRYKSRRYRIIVDPRYGNDGLAHQFKAFGFSNQDSLEEFITDVTAEAHEDQATSSRDFSAR